MKLENKKEIYVIEKSEELILALERIKRRIPKCFITVTCYNYFAKIEIIAPSFTFLYVERVLTPFGIS